MWRKEPKGDASLGWEVAPYSLECLSQSADCRMSMRRMEPLLLLYASMLQCVGWNSAEVITSVCSIRTQTKPQWVVGFDNNQSSNTPPSSSKIDSGGLNNSVHPSPEVESSHCRFRRVPVRSSMLTGFMSTMLKLWSLTSRFHKFILKSSADMYVSQSLHRKHNGTQPS